jgi:transcriptional regulator with XRE-family HTH domain
MAITSTLGQRIKQARLKKGLTQTQLAKKAGASSHTVICDYERGKRGKKRPDIRFLLKVAEALDISINYLFLGKD